MTDNAHQQTVIQNEDTAQKQTAHTEPVQKTPATSDNVSKVAVRDETAKDAKPEIKEASNSKNDVPSLKKNPTVALVNPKVSVDTKHIADIKRHKKGGFKKTESAVVAAIQESEPMIIAADIDIKAEPKQDLPIHNELVKKHLSPLFYANMINNVPLHITSEKEENSLNISSNQFISKVNSKIPFSGISKKCIDARKFTFEPEPVVAQYISKSQSKNAFTGYVGKTHSRQPLIHQPVIHQYVFAADNRYYPFSGTVQKTTSRYIQ